jgi:hypothetical protein
MKTISVYRLKILLKNLLLYDNKNKFIENYFKYKKHGYSFYF